MSVTLGLSSFTFVGISIFIGRDTGRPVMEAFSIAPHIDLIDQRFVYG